MPVVRNSHGTIFRPSTYHKEAEFERDVVSLADQIFGVTSIYLDIKKHMGKGIVTIPDGYLIDTTNPNEPKLFIIENEIVKADPVKHIANQLLRFVTSFAKAQPTLRTFLMDGIRNDPKLLMRLESACKESSSPNIDHYLDRAVNADFKGLVVIDEALPELRSVLGNIKADISVLELKAFESDSRERMFHFDTLYDEDIDEDGHGKDGQTPIEIAKHRAARKQRLASSDTVVVPARDEGFKDVFLGKNQWQAIEISAPMKDRIKYIAAYRVAPIGAVTHIAKVKRIKPYKDTGRYQIIFDGPAKRIKHVPLKHGMFPPMGRFYVQREKLLAATTLEDALR
ncbi:MAG TPA: hypothetical protein VIE66_18660 [Methylocella sp.]|jgi:hypothetical protein